MKDGIISMKYRFNVNHLLNDRVSTVLMTAAGALSLSEIKCLPVVPHARVDTRTHTQTPCFLRSALLNLTLNHSSDGRGNTQLATKWNF